MSEVTKFDGASLVVAEAETLQTSLVTRLTEAHPEIIGADGQVEWNRVKALDLPRSTGELAIAFALPEMMIDQAKYIETLSKRGDYNGAVRELGRRKLLNKAAVHVLREATSLLYDVSEETLGDHEIISRKDGETINKGELLMLLGDTLIVRMQEEVTFTTKDQNQTQEGKESTHKVDEEIPLEVQERFVELIVKPVVYLARQGYEPTMALTITEALNDADIEELSMRELLSVAELAQVDITDERERTEFLQILSGLDNPAQDIVDLLDSRNSSIDIVNFHVGTNWESDSHEDETSTSQDGVKRDAKRAIHDDVSDELNDDDVDSQDTPNAIRQVLDPETESLLADFDLDDDPSLSPLADVDVSKLLNTIRDFSDTAETDEEDEDMIEVISIEDLNNNDSDHSA